MADAATPSLSPADRAAVPIPENWRDLPWIARADAVSIRSIAALVSDTPVRNAADAKAAIEAELARRASDPSAPPASSA